MRVRLATTLAMTALALSAGCGAPDGTMEQPAMDGMAVVDAPQIPAVAGYYDGHDIAFVHPEASNTEIAELLTEMMDSPVLTVPSLASVPDEALSDVYVFANGVRPRHRGPLGFQPDVFPTAPGDPEYTPLRRVVLTTWTESAEPRELKSSDEVVAAERDGELTLERTEHVVNMPFLRWPDGAR